jgi:Fe-S cluster assembly protein SufD
VFEGLLQLQPGVRKITATLQNRNLLLSPQAQIDSRPQLEINAEDVQCSHGVTVGQLDEDAVFFLVSRGLSEAEARTLLSFAFANEIIGKIPLTACRDQARQAFLAALPQADIHQDWL